jgi:adenosylcobinamide amidohydrolase
VITEFAGTPVFVWRSETPWLALSSGVLGGGFGERHWVVNATVSHTYERTDPATHLTEIAAGLGLSGAGIGLLTAVDVHEVEHRVDDGVRVAVTTGIGAHPTWAAGPSAVPAPAGTINTVCWLPVRLSPAALVNVVATIAEAKAQALFEAGVPGTGTPTDSVAVLCPPDGPEEPFGGPRSPVGGAVARAVHSAIRAKL